MGNQHPAALWPRERIPEACAQKVSGGGSLAHRPSCITDPVKVLAVTLPYHGEIARKLGDGRADVVCVSAIAATPADAVEAALAAIARGAATATGDVHCPSPSLRALAGGRVDDVVTGEGEAVGTSRRSGLAKLLRSRGRTTRILRTSSRSSFGRIRRCGWSSSPAARRGTGERCDQVGPAVKRVAMTLRDVDEAVADRCRSFCFAIGSGLPAMRPGSRRDHEYRSMKFVTDSRFVKKKMLGRATPAEVRSFLASLRRRAASG